MESVSTSSNPQLCQICSENQKRYVCPKCNIGYCSVECYKSMAHLECSESFYMQWVQDELKTNQNDPELKQKTIDILQRIYTQNEDEDQILQELLEESNECDYEADLDSDDENLPSLEKRLENINLDDADKLWSALTVSEREEFEALIDNGEASKFLPKNEPWWAYHLKNNLIQEVNQSKEHQIYRNNCPKILDVPALESVFKTSPFIRFSIINVVYAYTFSVLHFIGEHHSTPLNATYIFLRVCESVRINRVFQDSCKAIQNVLLEITNCDVLAGDEECILETKKAGDDIIQGPEKDNKTFYVLAALSDLYTLVNESKTELSALKNSAANHEFNSKFQSNIDLGSFEMSKKNLSLLMKKIEFYIAWLKSQSQTYDITHGDAI